ncbi:hypothetical protein JOF29_006299 [Kribbella aluminosa]|uniref:DUF4129 domain-containing protein n=1 Tax=Kribbella aluminosa TaxID=416017 RepID=A0ABS4UU66_9ACTN|nr:hypothetical protein [Kribbella aluminosa]MBP2355189.1 hypothetical protein [Kribbella aluminosa]
MAWLVSLGVFLVLCVLLGVLLPNPPPARWRRGLQRGAAWLPERLIGRLIGRLRPATPPEPDPFDTLRLQTRLGTVSTKIRSIESTPHIYARAHRLMALEAAYDDLLDEACRLAGCPDPPDTKRSEAKRWEEEQALAARGWSW